MAALRLILLFALLSGTAAAASRTGAPALVYRDAQYCRGEQLVSVDPTTFEVLPGPRTRVAYIGGEGLPSADGRLLAFTGSDRLWIANRKLAHVVSVRTPPNTYEYPLAWQGSSRVVDIALVQSAHVTALTSMRVVDVVHRRVLAQAPFAYWASAGWGVDREHRVAMLLTRFGSLAAPRLVVAGRDGHLREVRLSRLRDGVTYRRASELHRQPGIAVDPVSSLAYVVSADESTAVVDLRTMRVRYAPRPRLTLPRQRDAPPAQATGTSNPFHGWALSADWAGGGQLLVGGRSWFLGTEPRGGLGDAEVATPAQLVDVRHWTTRTVAGDGRWVERADATLLVHGNHSTTAVADGRVMYRLPLSGRVVLRRLVTQAGKVSFVRDARSGRVLARVPTDRIDHLSGASYC